MDADQLICVLNGYPIWVEFDDATRTKIFDEIHQLSDLYRSGGFEHRCSIAARLDRAAKFQMFAYSRYKATEATRTRSQTSVMDGLIPVVMGGGGSWTATGGFLMAILFRSAELAGLDATRLFAVAAELAVSDEQINDVKQFPMASPEYRSLKRFGALERFTPEGVVYDMPGEQPHRRTWWDRIRGRRRVISKAETWKFMREVEKDWRSKNK
jgi:hypothetical protein